MNPYEKCPVFENESYLLRLVTAEDAADLLKVYSDERAAERLGFLLTQEKLIGEAGEPYEDYYVLKM